MARKSKQASDDLLKDEPKKSIKGPKSAVIFVDDECRERGIIYYRFPFGGAMAHITERKGSKW
jgi:hypothetical protein